MSIGRVHPALPCTVGGGGSQCTHPMSTPSVPHPYILCPGPSRGLAVHKGGKKKEKKKRKSVLCGQIWPRQATRADGWSRCGSAASHDRRAANKDQTPTLCTAHALRHRHEQTPIMCSSQTELQQESAPCRQPRRTYPYLSALDGSAPRLPRYFPPQFNGRPVKSEEQPLSHVPPGGVAS